MNRGRRGRVRRVRGGRNGRGRGRSRGVGSSPGSTNKRKGLGVALGEHVFTYNEKGATEQMRKTLKHIVKYTGNIYEQDIRNELHNRAVLTIENP